MLLGEVKQNCVRIEDRHAVVDDRWHLRVRIHPSKLGGVLLALHDIDRLDFVRRLELFKEHRDLRRIGGGVIIKLQHLRHLLFPRLGAGFSGALRAAPCNAH
jgi:hypothetical protein